MCGGSPSAPLPPPAVPEAPRAPDIDASQSAASRTRRRTGAQGRSTILTSSRGVPESAQTATKTLLGA